MKYLYRMVMVVIFGLLIFGYDAPAETTSCPLTLKNAYQARNSKGVYYITLDCTKRPIKNPDIFFSYFSSWKDVHVVAPTTLASVKNSPLSFMPWGPRRNFQNGSLIKIPDSSSVYVISNNTRRLISSEQVFTSLGYKWSWIETVDHSVMTKYAPAEPLTSGIVYPEGTVVKYANSPEIYALETNSGVNQRRYISSLQDLRANYRADHIITLPTTKTFADVGSVVSSANQSTSGVGQGTQSTPTPLVTTPATIPVTQPAIPPAPAAPVAPAPATPVTNPVVTNNVTVSTIAALRQALSSATAGTTITLTSGNYDLGGEPLSLTRAGTVSAPITVRAETANAAILNTNHAEEAFYLTQPYSIFQGLSIQVNGSGSYHAYKLNDNAHDVVIRDGKMEVFRGGESAIKGASPGAAGPYPDNLLVENNEIFFHEPTDYVVAEGIDGVGVKGWVIRGNNIHDIKIANTNSVAWGIVLKGNSQDSLIENNTLNNNDVAISVGGTTGAQWFRDGDATYEHRRAVVRNNTIRNTRDVAIYLERGHETTINNNTISASSQNGNNSAIDVRYAQSTANIYNNTLDKPIRDREGGTHTGSGNTIGSAPATPAPAPAPAQPASTPVVTPTPPPANNSSVPFSLETNSGLPGMYGSSVVTADFDGDNLPDIIMYGHYTTMYHSTDNPNGSSSELRIYRNVSTPSGAIRFTLQSTIADVNDGNREAVVVTGDFNGDGRPDFAVQSSNGGRGAAYINNGSWNFTRSRFTFNAVYVMTAADVNGDGKDDLIFAGDGGEHSGLWYSFDTATSGWVAHQTDYSHGLTYGIALATGDLNGDGTPDLVVGGNASVPFGSHDCSSPGLVPTSGDRLMYGEAVANLGGNNGFSQSPLAIVSAWGLKVPDSVRRDLNSCHGMDNAQMLIRDLDGDGKNDIVIAGSSTGQNGPVGKDGQQYDFAVLFNDGTGQSFSIWENDQLVESQGQSSGNGGVGNVNLPSIAVGDINGDGRPDIFVEGHRHDFTVSGYPYANQNLLFLNNGNRTFTMVDMGQFLPQFSSSATYPSYLNFLAGRPQYVAEGGVAMADFNNDGKVDLMFTGETYPYHTNSGTNYRDYNTASTLKAYVFRNTR